VQSLLLSPGIFARCWPSNSPPADNKRDHGSTTIGAGPCFPRFSLADILGDRIRDRPRLFSIRLNSGKPTIQEIGESRPEGQEYAPAIT